MRTRKHPNKYLPKPHTKIDFQGEGRSGRRARAWLLVAAAVSRPWADYVYPCAVRERLAHGLPFSAGLRAQAVAVAAVAVRRTGHVRLRARLFVETLRAQVVS